MDSVTLHIIGMACGGCANTVASALKSLDGVTEVKVSLVEAKAEVRFDPERVQLEQMKAAVEGAGYKVGP